jgi:hypothetical protein
MVTELQTVSKHVKTAGTVNPTRNEIAAVAYQLWLDSRCPVGSDREHWLQAEVMLRNALVAKREDLSGSPSIPTRDSRAGFEMVAERSSGRWGGHWEVWERECPSAQWVWDARDVESCSLNVS